MGRFAALTVLLLLTRSAWGGDAVQNWPCWRGPTGSGTSPDFGLKLATDPKDFKLVWKSEEQNLPKQWMHPRGTGTNKIAFFGGYGGPMLYDHRVYVAYLLPSGTNVDEVTRLRAKDQRPERWRKDADDMLICMDAAGGKTLWKTAMKGRGVSHQDHMHCPIFQPVVAEGKVYWSGSGGWGYCVDAATGALVWEAKLSQTADAMEEMKKTKTIEQFGQLIFFNACPAVADGVAVFSDLSDYSLKGRGTGKGHGLVAFDALTGKELWRLPECVASVSSPVVWLHKGVRRFVAAGPRRAVAVDPKTGKIAWEIPAPKAPPETAPADPKAKRRPPPEPQLHAWGTPAVCEDYLVLAGNFSAHGGAKPVATHRGLSCWRIGPEKAEPVWSLPPAEYSAQHESPLIYRGHVYTKAKGIACVKLDNGQVLGKAEGGHFDSLVGADGRLFNRTHTYIADPAGFRSVALKAMGFAEFVTVAFCEGRLYGRVGDGVVCYDLREK